MVDYFPFYHKMTYIIYFKNSQDLSRILDKSQTFGMLGAWKQQATHQAVFIGSC